MQISAVIRMESTPRSKHIKRWGRGEIDNVSATSWMSDEASPYISKQSTQSRRASQKPDFGMDNEQDKYQVGKIREGYEKKRN